MRQARYGDRAAAARGRLSVPENCCCVVTTSSNVQRSRRPGAGPPAAAELQVTTAMSPSSCDAPVVAWAKPDCCLQKFCPTGSANLAAIGLYATPVLRASRRQVDQATTARLSWGCARRAGGRAGGQSGDAAVVRLNVTSH